MFKYYDIRGIWGRDLNPESVNRLGSALRRIIDGEVALGKDVRFSSLPLFYHLIGGMGGEIIDLGITTTPMAYFFAWKSGVETLQITASHNPPEYNGLKPVHRNGLDWSHDEIRKLEEIYEGSGVSFNNPNLRLENPEGEYFEIFRSWEVPRVDLSFDASNGAGYLLTSLLSDKFDLKAINCIPDGRFPVHPPNPLDPVSLNFLERMEGTWAVMLDGDGDRLAIKYRERIVGTDEIVAFLGEHGAFQTLALEVTMPLRLEEYLKDAGIKVIRTPTGRVLIKEMAQTKKFDFFAEYSGHMGFKEFNYIDDPIYTLFKVLEIGGGSFETTYIPPLKSHVVSVRMGEEAIERIISAFDPDEIVKIDGIDLRREGGMLLIRKSRTEDNLYRLFWESESREEFKKIEALLREVVPWIFQGSS